MPELPEVEVLKRSLAPLILGKKLVSTTVFYEKALICEDLEKLKNKTIENLERRGKYLLFSLYPEGALLLHLRMTGKLIYKKTKDKTPHDHLCFELTEGFLYYNDVRKFGGFVYYDSFDEANKSLEKLGLEPFDDAFTGHYLYKKTRERKKPIKNFLLDQSTVAGLGNIYADEVLYKSGIRPQRLAASLSKAKCEKLASEIKLILEEAILLGGSSIKDYSNALGELGCFQNNHQVYGRGNLECKKCGRKLKKLMLAGRSTVFCPTCQK